MNKTIISVAVALMVILGSVGSAWAAEPSMMERFNGIFSPLANALLNFQMTTTLKPDLAVTSITVTPANPQPGQTMTVKAVITNVGKANAVLTSDMFRPEIPWLCTQTATCVDTGCSKIPLAKCNQWTTASEAHCTCGLSVIKTSQVLASGSRTTVSFTLAAPQTSNGYQFSIRLDPNKKLSESNLNKNIKSTAFFVGKAISCGGHPDRQKCESAGCVWNARSDLCEAKSSSVTPTSTSKPGTIGPNCGNGKIDVDEVCDGSNFGSNTCNGHGGTTNTTAGMTCINNCKTIDYSGCT